MDSLAQTANYKNIHEPMGWHRFRAGFRPWPFYANRGRRQKSQQYIRMGNLAGFLGAAGCWSGFLFFRLAASVLVKEGAQKERQVGWIWLRLACGS